MLEALDQWIGADRSNFNLYVGLLLCIFLFSIVTLGILAYRIGELDERRKAIQLKVNQIVLTFLVILLFFFMYMFPEDYYLIYMKLYLLTIISLALLCGAASFLYFFIKEHSC